MLKIVLAMSLCLWGAGAAGLEEKVFERSSGRLLTVSELAKRFKRGDIVVFGEQHATADNKNEPGVRRHHENQTRFLREIAVRPRSVSLGMEFIPYTAQSALNDYLAGELAEAEFLKAAGWGGNAFELYRDQLWVPGPTGGGAYALNIPRAISGQVARGGPDSLTPEQRELLPPLWERGSSTYFDRFASTMRGHVPEESIERYFWAQSLWDDTMAWQAVQASAPDQIFVLLVGEFHVEFGDGLPARLERHGAASVKTLLQHQVESVENEAELRRLAADDPDYGARADYIWFYSVK